MLSLGLLKIKNLNEGFNNNVVKLNGTVILDDKGQIIPYFIGWVGAFLLIINIIPAFLLAINCNPEHKIFYGILALLFSDVYLFQWAVRKFILKEKNYCKL